MRNTALHVFPPYDGIDEQPMRCSPNVLVALLVTQWKKLTRQEIEATYYRKRSIAKLIEKKYGINRLLAENYLTNIERTLPMAM